MVAWLIPPAAVAADNGPPGLPTGLSADIDGGKAPVT